MPLFVATHALSYVLFIVNSVSQGGNGQAIEEEFGKELVRKETEIFCEPPEPYFSMIADDFETDNVESTSTESLKSGGSNVRYNQ